MGVTDRHELQQWEAGSEAKGVEQVGVVSVDRVPAKRELLVVGGKMEVASDPQRYMQVATKPHTRGQLHHHICDLKLLKYISLTFSSDSTCNIYMTVHVLTRYI